MFSRTNHSLQGFAVLFGAVSKPGSDVPRQDALSGAGVEIPQYLRISGISSSTWAKTVSA